VNSVKCAANSASAEKTEMIMARGVFILWTILGSSVEAVEAGWKRGHI
jgi:hypothetical protein